MSKLSRVILGAVVVTAISPVLAVTPATAATTLTTTTLTTTVAASPGVVTSPNVSLGLCRLFPKLCGRVVSSTVGSAA